MKPLFFLFVLLSFVAAGCASSVPVSDTTIVASERSVVNGRNPVLFVGRTPDDGQWILLTDERAPQEVVVYAAYQDLVTFDSTLAQVRDLPVGWKATRSSKGTPWVREKFSLTQQMALQPKEAAALDKMSRPKSSGMAQYFVAVLENDGSSYTRQIGVTEKALNVWRLEGDPGAQTSILLWSDTLSATAHRTVDSLVHQCGLDTLKDVYTAPTSGSGKKLRLSIWDVAKGRSTFSELRGCWVPSLYELCVYINSRLPKRYVMDLAF
jgi:hypothetical protein